MQIVFSSDQQTEAGVSCSSKRPGNVPVCNPALQLQTLWTLIENDKLLTNQFHEALFSIFFDQQSLVSSECSFAIVTALVIADYFARILIESKLCQLCLLLDRWILLWRDCTASVTLLSTLRMRISQLVCWWQKKGWS